MSKLCGWVCVWVWVCVCICRWEGWSGVGLVTGFKNTRGPQATGWRLRTEPVGWWGANDHRWRSGSWWWGMVFMLSGRLPKSKKTIGHLNNKKTWVRSPVVLLGTDYIIKCDPGRRVWIKVYRFGELSDASTLHSLHWCKVIWTTRITWLNHDLIQGHGTWIWLSLWPVAIHYSLFSVQHYRATNTSLSLYLNFNSIYLTMSYYKSVN